MSNIDPVFLSSYVSSCSRSCSLSCSLPVDGSLSLAPLPVDGCFISHLDKFLHGSSGWCWDLLYELLHASRLLVVPSFIVPCFFTRGLVQEVSSVQTLATRRACFQNRGKSHLKLALPQQMPFVTPSLSQARVMCPCWTFSRSTSSKPTCFNRCLLLSSSHFIVSTFLLICFHRAWSFSCHVGLSISAFVVRLSLAATLS